MGALAALVVEKATQSCRVVLHSAFRWAVGHCHGGGEPLTGSGRSPRSRAETFERTAGNGMAGLKRVLGCAPPRTGGGPSYPRGPPLPVPVSHRATVHVMATWRQIPMPMEFNDRWRETNGEEFPPPRMYERNGIRALVGREQWVADGTVRWHISASGPGRVPTWDELVQAAHELRPGVPFCMGVPPQTWWMNVHPHVLHMWETNDAGLIEEWRMNARGDRVT